MKTNPVEIILDRAIPREEGLPIVFVPFGLESSLTELNTQFDRYRSNNGQMDIFSFIELKMRILRMKGEFHSASDYGLIHLSLYEQELLKAYKYIISDTIMSTEEKIYAINWIISRINIREMLCLILMWEHQIILGERFSYWKDKFHKLLFGFREEEPKKNNQDVARNVHQEVQNIFRILDGN